MNFNDKKKLSFSSPLAILLYAITAGLLASSFMAFIIFNIDTEERLHIERVTQSTADTIKVLLEDDLKKRIIFLAELSQLPPTSSHLLKDNWRVISKTLYDSQYGYQAIGWIDNSFHVRKIIPEEGNEIAIGFDLAEKPAALSAAIKAQKTEQVVITNPLFSIHGSEGLGLYAPVFSTLENSKQLHGFIAGVLLFKPYIKSVIPTYLLKEHNFILLIDGQVVYSNQNNQLTIKNSWNKKASYNLQAHQWQINISPKNEFLYVVHYKVIGVIITLAIFIAILIALAAYTYLIARNKTVEIKDGRNKVEHLLKNLPGMAYQSFDTKSWPMMRVSDGCETLTGYTREQFKNNRILWQAVIYPDDYQRVKETINTAIKNHSSFEIEYRINTKSNSVKLVWEKGGAVDSMYNDDVVIEGFVYDITSIKKAEADLITSYAFSDAVVNAMIDGVITIDQYGLIKSFNNAAQSIFGYTYDEVLDKNVSILMPASFSHHHDQYLAQYLTSKQAHIIGIGRELVAKHKDGSTFPIHLSVSEINNHENKMFVGLIRNITQQRALEDQAQLHTEQLAHSERVNALGEMAAGIAHEINQPLTAISLFSQTAKNFCESGKFDRLPALFEKLSLHALRASAVIERMQKMTKKGKRTKEIIDCNLMIIEVSKLAEFEARLHNITIKIIACEQPTNVYVDRVQIQQVVLNLLRNGMEAMQSIESDTTIELKIKLNMDKYLEISVTDTGAGLPEEMRETLFKPFSSTKQNGTGIGLSISKSIVEEHGGHIHFHDNKPTGAIFMFTLPIHDRGIVYDK
tara:strand:+ start:20582 stop:22978 length:2397 start_codon:yes stop_codon:yes gene_type:complete